MHVVLGHHRHIVVNDVGDLRDIETTRRDIGRDQDIKSTIAKTIESPLPLALRPIAVDVSHLQPRAVKNTRKPVGTTLRASEDKHGALTGCELFQEDIILCRGIGLNYFLLDSVNRLRYLAYRNTHRIAKPLRRERLDVGRHRGGKE